MAPTTKIIAKDRTSAKTKVDAKAEVAKGALRSMGAAGVIVTIWSVASLIGGMVASGGPVSLVKAWIAAVTGH